MHAPLQPEVTSIRECVRDRFVMNTSVNNEMVQWIRQAAQDNNNKDLLPIGEMNTWLVLSGETLYRALCEASAKGYNRSVEDEKEAFRLVVDMARQGYKGGMGVTPSDTQLNRKKVLSLRFPLTLVGLHAHWSQEEERPAPEVQVLRVFSSLGPTVADLPVWVLDEAQFFGTSADLTAFVLTGAAA